MREREEHSNWWEAKAVLLAFMSFRGTITGRTVRLFTDNSVTLAYQNKLGGRKFDLTLLIQQQHEWMTTHGVELALTEHIQGVTNTLADLLSRVVDDTDWKVNPALFQHVDDAWGPHTIDRMATMLNAQLPRYNSLMADPHAEAFDAFTQHWRGEETREVNWVNPPWELIEQVVDKVLRERATTTLVTPNWRSKAWFGVLERTAQDMIFVRRANDTYLPGRLGNSEPMGSPKWDSCIWRLSFP